MNETLDDQSQGPWAGSAPHESQLHQDLDRLRRSTTNRYVAGVAGGLGRHFNIDPTILRVLLVVLTFFGGAGLVVYAVCWLFVPEDDAEHAVIHVGSEPRKILLLAAAAVAFLLAVGDAFSGFDGWWPIVIGAVVVALVLIGRDRRNNRAAARADQSAGEPVSTWTAPAPAYAPSSSAVAESSEDTQVLEQTEAPAPSWQAPPAQPPGPPTIVRPPLLRPRRKRTGVVWFWPTLALIAVALGALGLYDNNHHVTAGAYPALALGITAVMLLVGSVVGRPGGLILVGLASSVVLLGNIVVGGSFGVDAREMQETPTTSAQVESDYANTVGEIRLDLSQVSDPEALAGRQIHVHLRTGNLEVIVPRSLNVEVDADMHFGGGITLPDDDSGGFNHQVHKRLNAVPASTAEPLELDLDASFGQITVEYR